MGRPHVTFLLPDPVLPTPPPRPSRPTLNRARNRFDGGIKISTSLKTCTISYNRNTRAVQNWYAYNNGCPPPLLWVRPCPRYANMGVYLLPPLRGPSPIPPLLLFRQRRYSYSGGVRLICPSLLLRRQLVLQLLQKVRTVLVELACCDYEHK